MARGRPGPSLPQSLLEELDSAASNGRPGGRKGSHQKLSRREARKQERDQKKVKRAQHFSHQHAAGAVHSQPPASAQHTSAKGKGKEKQASAPAKAEAAGTKRQADREHADSPKRKKVKFAVEDKSASKPATKENATPGSSKDAKSKPKKKEPTALEKLAARTDPSSSKFGTGVPVRRAASKQEKDEDAYIQYLESKLGWSKGGSRTNRYGKGLEDDGLDDLLRDIDNIETSIFSSGAGDEEYPEEEDEEMEWTDVEVEDSEEEDEDEEVEEDDVEDEAPSLLAHGEEDEAAEDSSESVEDSEGEEEEDAEWTGLGGPTESTEKAATSSASDEPDTKAASSQPVPGTRYVPPHLRNRQAGPEAEKLSEEQIKLQRQLKGLLNRMSEQNISTILDSMEDIYRDHRRHDVTSTLTTLIVDGISSHSMLLDSYVVLHAAFVAALHKIVGIEFAAYFVQNVVASYEKHLATAEAQSPSSAPEASEDAPSDTRGKEASNLLVLLSELFNFGVISHVLMYDLIRTLLGGALSELRVELVLKVARDAGQQLRAVDPAALKDIITIVHAKLPADPKAMGSRTRFMVETLTNLKNNKVKKAAGGGATGAAGSEAVERMKKFLSGLTKRKHVKTHEPLRVSLDDLHSAESKGKWWLVGAAWGGDPLVDRQQEKAGGEAAVKTESTENVLLKLAKKQGMNTDIRRSIFVVLMSSEDYVDACERLSQLKLTEVQQREIVRVILHCCGNEKAFNPYYAFVIQHLCRNAHAHKITLQFCLWDFLRDLGETAVGGAEVLKNIRDDAVGFDLKKISDTRMRNVARAYAWWLAKDCCTLAILKPVDFTVLKPTTQRFLKELFIHLLVSTQLPTPLLTSDPNDFPTTRNRAPIEEVFIKATRIQALAYGLVYFLGEVFQHEAETDGNGFLVWANKVAVDTLRTGVDIAAGGL
ncbi:MIF4G and MA3 domain-containing protein [Phanerochaete sordida]|uniref:MIF4G and MA3 domain-containing protein n=1 Tax=Phanerochaete sordida TaxID=48140 RepID=A0A9P3G6A2_9APHY|nr:MIF4G and MA3 domain-containing protein [Phanerochaete sordida]